MLFGLPATHVDAHCGDYGLRILHFNAVDAREVHARDALQLPAKVKTRLMPTRVDASARFRNGFAHRVDSGFHASQLPVNAFSTCLNLLLVGLVKIQALFENE
jgi:hypothetical protein